MIDYNNFADLDAGMDLIARVCSEHIRVHHYAQTRRDKAITILVDRMLELINDRLAKGDDMGELNDYIDPIDSIHGPRLHFALRNAAFRRVDIIRGGLIR